MAALDYGVIVKIDGEVVNRNAGDTAHYMDASRFPAGVGTVKVNGLDFKNSFQVYLGNKKLMVAFYKTVMCIMKDGEPFLLIWCQDDKTFTGYQKITVGNAVMTLTRLDRNRNTGRYYAEWTHNKKHYAVIFGYGVTNMDSSLKYAEKAYGYTSAERQRIEAWLK